MEENEISRIVIGAAIEVHKTLGPGLLEAVYQQCLGRELEVAGLSYTKESPVSLSYKGIEFDVAYRADLLVEDKVIIELKVVENLLPIHMAQLLSYLRLDNKRLGLLINFNTRVLRDGIKRIVNKL